MIALPRQSWPGSHPRSGAYKVTLPTSASAIHVSRLSKTYFVPEREAGLKAALRSLVRRKTRAVKAVDHISFDIAPGEVVGFLGPKRACKNPTPKTPFA